MAVADEVRHVSQRKIIISNMMRFALRQMTIDSTKLHTPQNLVLARVTWSAFDDLTVHRKMNLLFSRPILSHNLSRNA